MLDDTPAAKGNFLRMDAREQVQEKCNLPAHGCKTCCKMNRQIPRPVGLKNCIPFCLVATFLPTFIDSVVSVI